MNKLYIVPAFVSPSQDEKQVRNVKKYPVPVFSPTFILFQNSVHCQIKTIVARKAFKKSTYLPARY